MSVVSPQNQAGLVQIHRDLRDATLRILSQRMQSELSREATPIHEDSEASGLIEMILTMICLCYGEMFIPNSTGWKLHLTGVRAGFERYNLRYHYEESVSRFFVEELEYLEAFGSISSFTPTSRRRKPISQHPTCDDYFKEFTDSLHDITATERSQHQAYQAGSPFADTNMSVWKNQLMSSYEAVCARIDSTPPQDVAVQIGLRSLLKAQHYACLVYSYQALAPDSEREKAIPTLVDCLYNEIIFMTSWPTEAVSHNISFPLFILGTESQLYTEKQIMVERLFTESIAATGFSCNSTVLQFLNEFWNATADGAPKSWIQYARENKEKISPFIVF
ncbi:hypothetical protein FOVG_17717 [Fusarium oxysporum f. sp. pisi HDV247]|uniref:Uncharacterized protein n=1 Tax=Fusarium oxysporum f. sp. pisi HDV247 TaxID=1080344 RepID=W9NT18_FUSOX|nr:hypothetical protein FOVG_17717 [Fusarium oxysporum f. sp. pisi HDV247]